LVSLGLARAKWEYARRDEITARAPAREVARASRGRANQYDD